MSTLLAWPWGGLKVIESRIVKWSWRPTCNVFRCVVGLGCSRFEAAEPSEGLVHRILHTSVWAMQDASYLRYGFGELKAIRFMG
jgi:hypothetical protein